MTPGYSNAVSLKRLWLHINQYETQAKQSKNQIKKNHFIKMADQLRIQLPTNEDVEEEFKQREDN